MEESHSDNLRLMLRALTKLGDKVAANPGEALLELDQLIEQYPGLTQAVEKLTEGIRTDDSQNTDEVLTAPQRKALMIFDFDKTLSKEDCFVAFVDKVLELPPDQMKERLAELKEAKVPCRFEELVTERLQMLKEAGRAIHTEDIENYGQKILLAPGLTGPDNFFDRMRTYAADKGIDLEFHIDTSNLEEVVRASPIGHEFKTVNGTRLEIDETTGIAERQVGGDVIFTDKTRIISAIRKGVTDEYNDNPNVVNLKYPDEIPMTQVIYTGDGQNDIAALSMVRQNRGGAIGVYDPEHSLESTRLLRDDKRTEALLPQDYREGSALDLAFKKQIDRIQERLHVEELAYGRSKAKGKEQGIALSAAPCEATQAL